MSVVTTIANTNRRTAKTKEPTETPTEIPTWFYLLGIVILSIGFWFPEHGWTQSQHFADVDDILYDGTENITADKLEGIDKYATVTRIGLAILGLIWFWVQRRYRLCTAASALWFGLAFGCLIYGSFFWSINPSHTLFKLVVLSCVGAAALGFATAFTLKQLLEWIALTCAVYLSIGLLAEFSLGTFQLGGGHRFVGTTHPNTEAIFGAILCLSAQLFYRPDRSKVLTVLLVALAVFCIISTKSRTTLAAVVVSFIVMQILAARGNNRVFLILAFLFAGGCVAAGSVLVSSQGSGQIGSIMAMGRTDDVTSLTGRLPLWEELSTWIYKSPVFGYGYLAFWDAKRVEYLSETFKWEIPHGHNMYLDITLDVGFVGSILFACLLVSGLLRAASLYIRTTKVEYAIVVGIFICAMINGAGESLFKLPGLPLFALVSSFIAILHQPNAIKEEKPRPARSFKRRIIAHENR